jgi:hypothetical protein
MQRVRLVGEGVVDGGRGLEFYFEFDLIPCIDVQTPQTLVCTFQCDSRVDVATGIDLEWAQQDNVSGLRDHHPCLQRTHQRAQQQMQKEIDLAVLQFDYHFAGAIANSNIM